MHPTQWSAPPDPAVIRKRRRGRLLLILALLVVGLPALACYRGIEQETETTTLVTKKVGQNVGEALSYIATLPNPLGDPTAARTAVHDGERTYYTANFAAAMGDELSREVEQNALAMLSQDVSVPPLRFDTFAVHPTMGTTVEADATVEFPGFLGRTRTLYITLAMPLPRYTSLRGWKSAP